MIVLLLASLIFLAFLLLWVHSSVDINDVPIVLPLLLVSLLNFELCTLLILLLAYLLLLVVGITAGACNPAIDGFPALSGIPLGPDVLTVDSLSAIVASFVLLEFLGMILSLLLLAYLPLLVFLLITLVILCTRHGLQLCGYCY
jgi:hypothetical protein